MSEGAVYAFAYECFGRDRRRLSHISLDLQVDPKVYDSLVSSIYKIKDVADRSGFSAATLRYYEEIGLLPEASRTPAGSRAKQLGCSLDEIADLTVAWDGGHCGPVQDRLRAVVADKLVTAQQHIVELMTLTSELQRAAAALETHRPEGPCDDNCGCVSDTPAPVARQPVTLGTKPDSAYAAAPIACTLESQSMRGRLDEWQRLLEHVERRDLLDNGVRATFGSATPLTEVIRLAAAEQDCCQFFTFAITIDHRGVALEVRAPDDALPVLHSLFGHVA